MASSALYVVGPPVSDFSSDTREVTLAAEDAAAISGLLETFKLEFAILRHRIATLEGERGAVIERFEAAEKRLQEAVRDRAVMTEALQEREHRMWSAEARAQDCEHSARASEARATAVEIRECEANARLARVREALEESTVQPQQADVST
jgi:chromosome segregation ATPase